MRTPGGEACQLPAEGVLHSERMGVSPGGQSSGDRRDPGPGQGGRLGTRAVETQGLPCRRGWRGITLHWREEVEGSAKSLGRKGKGGSEMMMGRGCPYGSETMWPLPAPWNWSGPLSPCSLQSMSTAGKPSWTTRNDHSSPSMTCMHTFKCSHAGWRSFSR